MNAIKLLAVAVLAVGVSAQANDWIYARGISKVYAFLPPSHRVKSANQMQAEETVSRTKYSRLLTMDNRTEEFMNGAITPVKDQGKRGTCVAFATVAMIESQIKEATGKDVDLSEQYLYWESKAVAKVGPHQEGSEPIEMLKAIDTTITGESQEIGVPAAQAWPYEKTPWYADNQHPDCVAAFSRNENKLPTKCVTNGNPAEEAISAPKITVSKAQEVPSSPEAIVGLISQGVAVEVGLDVYRKAWAMGIDKNDPDAKELVQQHVHGIVKMPTPDDEVVGGHAILIVGFNKTNKTYIFKNSWGTDEWASQGIKPGFGIIPMAYVQKFGQAAIAKANLPNSPARPQLN